MAEELKNLLAENKIEVVIKKLKANIKNKKAINELLIIENNFRELLRQENMGLMKREHIIFSKNNILDRLIRIIDVNDKSLVSLSDRLGLEKKTTFSLKLKANIDIKNKNLINPILSKLMEISDDYSLELIEVTRGSIILKIKCLSVAYIKLQCHLNSKILNSINSYLVLDVKKDNTPRDRSLFEEPSNTKKKILRTTINLFNLYGLENVRIKDITNATNVSLGNITYHYKHKGELIEKALEFFIIEIENHTENMFQQIKDGRTLLNSLETSFLLHYEFRFIFIDNIKFLLKNYGNTFNDLLKVREKFTANLNLVFLELKTRGILDRKVSNEKYRNLSGAINLYLFHFLFYIEISRNFPLREHFNNLKRIISPYILEDYIFEKHLFTNN